jgi:hypothetical protein
VSTPTGAAAAPEGGKPGYFIWIVGRTPLSRDSANPVLTTLRKELEKAAKDMPMLSIVSYFHDFSVTAQAVSGGGGMLPTPMRGAYYDDERDLGDGPRFAGPRRPTGPAEPDPLFPDEDAAKDVYFQIGLIVAIEGDGVSEPNASSGP